MSAFLHVKANKGRAGLDRVSIAQFETDLDVNIGTIHNKLKTEIYKPSPVLRVFIPKGRNQKRPLGIPTVCDRVVQQAFRTIIEPIFESSFSDHSFGFRTNRNCHQAIMRVEQYKSEGYHYVLDADIKAFYDTIPHQLIMDSLREKIADDFIVMTKTAEELPATLSFVREIVEGKLKMKLSEDKTSLTNFKRGFRFLGYSFMGRYKGISHKSLDKLKDNVRQITRRTQGRNLQMVIQRLNPVIRGHVNYFRLGDMCITYRVLDAWLRMRLRCFKFARKWRTDNKRLRVRRFDRMGLLSFEREFLMKRAKA